MTPRATYRIQFHKNFTFLQAAEHADYFGRLGVSHIYSSPILKARAGSRHGYDVIDYSTINPELGGEADFRKMASRLRARGLGIILDIVPNHMAVGRADNPWWLDLLQNGCASRFARYFDIDWDAPGLEGKVLAPFLRETVIDALENGALRLEHDTVLDQLAFAYYEHRFPLRLQDQNIGNQHCDLGALKEILDRQNFVLASWTEADSRINWRRFFAITDLAALQTTRQEVFEAIHSKIFELYDESLIDGVRVDHVDGIAEPGLYCRMLRQRLEALRPGSYIVVEKILAEEETLPSSWQVDGTTGYDFMNDISGLEHFDDAGALESLWFENSDRKLDFESEELKAREEILRVEFQSQLKSTARAFQKLLPSLDAHHLAEVLSAIILGLRCYRSYANGRPDTPGPGKFLRTAMARARASQALFEKSLELVGAIFERNDEHPLVIDALRRFSQLSTSVAAKAVEDTAFFRYGRLLSRNDVGFDPRRRSLSISQFHHRILLRTAQFPRTMTATATHDHKRGEDARARLAALSEQPVLWQNLSSAFPPQREIHREDAYFLLQTLVASWPVEADEGFSRRIENWCTKHLREANLRSSWISPDNCYESKFMAYAHDLIVGSDYANLRRAISRFVKRIEPSSKANSLIQVVLHCTVPGVTDVYQGCEFEDLSLTDPDNRRNIDYSARRESLQAGNSTKQLWLARLLNARKKNPDLWLLGDYHEIHPETSEKRLIAFSRSYAGASLLVFALRHASHGPCRAEIAVDRPYVNLLTQENIASSRFSLAKVLDANPAAVLYSAAQDDALKPLPSKDEQPEGAFAMNVWAVEAGLDEKRGNAATYSDHGRVNSLTNTRSRDEREFDVSS